MSREAEKEQNLRRARFRTHELTSRRPTELPRRKEGLHAVIHLMRNGHFDTDIPCTLPF